MLRALLLLMFLTAPWANAQTPLISSTADTTIVNHVVEVVPPQAEPTEDSDDTMMTASRTVNGNTEVNSNPEGRGSGNLFGFEDYNNCVVNVPIPSVTDTEFEHTATAGGSFVCRNVANGRSPSSHSIELLKNSPSDDVTFSIEKVVTMRTDNSMTSIGFLVYRSFATTPTSIPLVAASRIAVEYLLPGETTPHTASVYFEKLYPPATTAGSTSTDGQWERYHAIFNVDSGSSSTTPVPVTLTLKITRNQAATETSMLIDDINVRYHRYIQNPSGDFLFDEDFDVCANVGSFPSLNAALNSQTPLVAPDPPSADRVNPWNVDSNQVCSTVQKHTPAWSLLMSNNEQVIPDTAGLLRTITKIVDVDLVGGQEVTLEFWIRWEEGSNPFINQQRITTPTISASAEVDSGATDFRTTFRGDFMPGPRVIDTTTASEENGFWRYRSVFTLPTSLMANRNVKFRITLVWAPYQESAINSGLFYIDDVSLRYTTFVFTRGVVGDPQFVGLYNQNYQVHGIDGGVYNLVSSPTTQVNSRFVFLAEGKCPILDGIPARNCFAHPGSYLGAIGIQEVVDGVNHKLTIVSGPSQAGFASIELDGMKLSVNDSVAHGSTFDVHFVTSHVVMVNTADFAFTFENSDMFINQGVAAHRRLSQLTCHGLFGQTHKRVIYPSKLKYIEGEVDDYLIAEDDLFGRDFVYNQFHA